MDLQLIAILAIFALFGAVYWFYDFEGWETKEYEGTFVDPEDEIHDRDGGEFIEEEEF